jgi:uncharacterized protein (TIGR00299 family) protein
MAKMQLHLDPLGGISGDMFVGALLDTFPEHRDVVAENVRKACDVPGLICQADCESDGVLRGTRFRLSLPIDAIGISTVQTYDGSPFKGYGLARGHEHHHWRFLRTSLEESLLSSMVKHHAIAMFERLAEAEARVHGVPADDVTFHEVGAWDSIADLVAAATLIAAVDASRWTVSALPLGGGRVASAHGPLPVPAPASALLLEGFATVDDGIQGERVTPTGAVIVNYLCSGSNPNTRATGIRRLLRSGIGFGARRLSGISNCLRVLVFEEDVHATVSHHRELAVIEFEVDDQSAEDLAAGLDRLRTQADVFDIVQVPVFGKKGRLATSVRVLTAPNALEGTVAACFRETTTIGLRYHLVQGMALARELRTVEIDGRPLRVKLARRPDGVTAKTDIDDTASTTGHAQRIALRRKAERDALNERAS